MSITLTSRCEREMDCPKEVVIWNYFDHEHVVGTHYKHYSAARVMVEKDGWCIVHRSYRLPVIGLKSSSVGFMALLTPDHIKSYQFNKLGLVLDQDIYFKDLGPERCLVATEYRLEVPGIFRGLQPLWKAITQRWFDYTWEEDAPMRLRRWKLWKLGFKDFRGLDYVNKGTAAPAEDAEREYPIELPVKKSTPITKPEGYSRLFATSVETGYSPESE